MKTLEKQCLECEEEYREWRESPVWYCVKTELYNDGRVKCEVMANEKTKMPIAIQSFDKPMDGTFEEYDKTTYYTYHQGFKEAERQLLATRV